MAQHSVLQRSTHSLKLEMKQLHNEPVEGFSFKVDENNIFDWEVAIFGPPETLYEGGYFKASMKFPNDYPYSPPSVRFLTKMWHPNIYPNGDVCISILHPPVDDATSGELLSERWNPTQNIRTVLLSIISMLSEPNTLSPANVDASVSFRRWKDGIDKGYESIIRKEVLVTKIDAEKDGVIVPTTVKDYCITGNKQQNSASVDNEDYFVNDYGYDDDEGDDDDDEDCCLDTDDEDSGNDNL